MLMHKVILMLLLGIVSNSVMAEKYFIFGMGHNECGEYLANRGSDDKSIYNQVYATWVQGYFSGYNSTMPKKQFDAGLPPSTILAYLDKYCRDNPLSNVAVGTDCLFKAKGIDTGSTFDCK